MRLVFVVAAREFPGWERGSPSPNMFRLTSVKPQVTTTNRELMRKPRDFVLAAPNPENLDSKDWMFTLLKP